MANWQNSTNLPNFYSFTYFHIFCNSKLQIYLKSFNPNTQLEMGKKNELDLNKNGNYFQY